MGTKKKSPSITELCARVEFLEEKLSDYDRLLHRVEKLESSLIIADNCRKLLLQKVDDTEQYTRRLNLIVSGLPVQKGSSDSDIRQMILAEIKRLKLPLTERDVDRAHRIRKPFKDKNGRLQVPIIVRFASWFARNEVYSKRRESSFFWSADLTERRRELLDVAKKELLVDGSPAQKLIKSAVVDRNCRLVLVTNDKRIFSFNSTMELHRAVQNIEDTQAPYDHIWKILENVKKGAGYPVVNVDDMHVAEWLADPNNVYVGEGNPSIPKSTWANPFRLGIDGSQDDILSRYRDHITSAPNLVNNLGSLRGKVLGCHCDITSTTKFCCHAQVLQEVVGNL